MKYNIKIIEMNQDHIIFDIDDVTFTVDMETDVLYQQYPVSFNSFNDKIIYAEDEILYYRIDCNSLHSNIENYYDCEDICYQLEEKINNT